MSESLPIFKKCYNWNEAARVREAGIYPFFKPIERNAGSKVIIEGREMIMAGSNNYLGLALDPRLQKAAEEVIEVYGTSCSGSRFMNGTMKLHEDLEVKLAEFVGKESAVCFTTGHQTNLGAISALVGRGDYVITDKYNHASIMDGIFLSCGMHRNVHVLRFRHNDLEDLENKLKTIPKDAAGLLVTDGVFSMEGDICRLPEMRELADKYNVALYLDEAHAIGVIGETGKGTTEHYNDPNLADIIMCTFSKSLGSIGGFVAGDHRVIDYIKHFARPLMFSASVPPAMVAAASTALDIIIEEPERVHRLQEIGKKMVSSFKELGFNVGTAETPIVPLVIGDNDKTFMFWKNLFERGIYVNPVISPAVPPNRSLIRTSYMAIHTDEELDFFLEVAADEARKLGII